MSLMPMPLSTRQADDQYLSLKELRVYAGLCVRTLQKYLDHPVTPLPYYRIGGRVLVKRTEYDIWAQTFRVTVDPARVALLDTILAGMGK